MTSRRKKSSSKKSGKLKSNDTLSVGLKKSNDDNMGNEVEYKIHKSNKGKKIRKSCTTKEYQNTEREVQMLLGLNKKPKYGDDGADRLSESVVFFVESVDMTSRLQHAKSETSNTSDEELEELDEEEREDTDNGATYMHSGPTPHQVNETTYIQIEDLAEQLESLVTAQVVTGRRLQSHHKFCDNDLLYKPCSQPTSKISIAKVKSSEYTINHILQRLHVEAHAQNTKVPVETIESLLHHVEYEMDVRKGIFRTYCSSEAHEFQPIFCPSTVDAIEIHRRKLLRVFIQELRFDEHPALLEEHRLANRLDDLYDEYVQREQAKECDRLEMHLTMERQVLQQLMLQKPQSSNVVAVNRLADQSRLVRELRCRLYAEEINSRELLQNLLQLWQQLKELRKRQQRQCTRLQLRLQVIPESKTRDASAQQRLTDRFERDLGEVYHEQLQAYYQAKRLWRLSTNSNNHGTLEKPKRPNLKRLAHELKETLLRCTGAAPGESKVRVLRIKDAAYHTMSAGMSNASQQRKSFFLKLYCDNEFVGVTRTYRMESDFRLHINEAIGIVLQRRFPKQLRISLYEKDKLMTTKKLANILLPLNTFTAAAFSNSDGIRKITFRSHKQSQLAGRLSLRCECEDETASDAASIVSLIIETPSNCDNNDSDSYSSPKKAVKIVSKETCFFEETRLQFCRSAVDMEGNGRFRLLRERYLQRNENLPQLRFIPALTYELPDEQLNAIQCGTHAQLRQQTLIEPGNWMEPIDVQRHDGKRRLHALYEALQGQCARLHKMLEHTEQLLINDEPASWGSFFRTLQLIFNPNRALAPALDKDACLSVANLNANSKHSFRIVLMIVRGTGIPVRNFHNNTISQDEYSLKQQQNTASSSTAFMAPNIKYSNVHPFIVLSYKDKCCRSTTAEGSDPTWNEQLVLPLSGIITELIDDVKISMYDEIVEQQPLSDGDLEGSTRRSDIYQQRIHTNWLGEYRVPLSTLLAVPKSDGVIELQMPQVLLGYQSPVLADNLVPLDVTSTEQQQHIYPEIRDTVHLWCYISCEPGALFAAPLRAHCLECIESMEVQQQLQQWSTMVKELQPQRYHPPLVCIPEGKRVCLTRMLQPISLPPFLELNGTNLVEYACRFVSLLSVLRQPNASVTSLQGVWLNNRWLLDTGWSSAKDLGVFLCNLLLRIGLKCWLVLGVTSTHGECSYVLYHNTIDSIDSNNMWLIEPTTGKRYTPRDVFCPLIRVHYIVTQTNIYCNIQREVRVFMTSFNINDATYWLPAFNKRIAAPSGGVQQMHYSYKTLHSTHNLRHHIERKIMKKITAWRTMRKTIWNRAFQPRLLVILEQLEHTATVAGTNNVHMTNAMPAINYTKQLAVEFPSYRFYGFTLNFAYTNLTAISERIKSTGLHLRNEPRIEFTVAVHIHSYPQNVHSIWLFLLASVPDMTP